MRQGDFRQDLFFRLRVVTIHVPPLRRRIEDIPALTDHFLQKIGRELGTGICRLQQGVVERLMRHTWNGNVRELENVLVEAVVKANGKVILLDEIERILQTDHHCVAGGLASFSLLKVEKEHIETTLRQMGWNRTQTARALGISLPTLRSKIKKYGIEPPC